MVHSINRVTSFNIVGPYTLRVVFADLSEQTINFQPILAGDLYRPLRDIKVFNQVRIDPEVHTLVWPNGADFRASYLARLAPARRGAARTRQTLGTCSSR